MPTSRRPAPRATGYIVIGAIVAAAAVGWAIIVAYSSGEPGITSQVITFRILNDREAQLTYEVTKPSGKEVRCVVRALDVKHGEVARTEVAVPPGTDHVKRTQRLPTSARATTVEVRDCRSVKRGK